MRKSPVPAPSMVDCPMRNCTFGIWLCGISLASSGSELVIARICSSALVFEDLGGQTLLTGSLVSTVWMVLTGSRLILYSTSLPPVGLVSSCWLTEDWSRPVGVISVSLCRVVFAVAVVVLTNSDVGPKLGENRATSGENICMFPSDILMFLIPGHW